MSFRSFCDRVVVLRLKPFSFCQPFASLIDRVGPDVPRVLINQEVVGEAPYEGARKGFHFDLSVDEGGRDGQSFLQYLDPCSRRPSERSR